VTFVRSITMDTFREDQLQRLRLGGNKPFKAFVKAYPAEGGYFEGISPTELYHTWAATQYRDKLTADVEGVPWSPTSPPPVVTSGEPPTRTASGQRNRASRPSTSPSPLGKSESDVSATSFTDDPKIANELYFERLGQTNASRPSGVAPSQGGRFEGFGSTPTPEPSQHPSYGISSANAPTLSDFQDNPVKALSKGWGLLTAVASVAGKAVNESIIQPSMEKAMDPNLRAAAAGYVSQASKKAQDAASGANELVKQQLGVDVANKARETLFGPGPRGAYSTLQSHPESYDERGLYNDDGDENFFDTHMQPPSSGSTVQPRGAEPTVHDEEEEWKDF